MMNPEETPSTQLTAAMHQANEHRMTSIEGWLRMNALAVITGAVIMGLQLFGLREKIIEQNGRVTKLEHDHIVRDGREEGASKQVKSLVKLFGIVLIVVQIVSVIIGVFIALGGLS